MHQVHLQTQNENNTKRPSAGATSDHAVTPLEEPPKGPPKEPQSFDAASSSIFAQIAFAAVRVLAALPVCVRQRIGQVIGMIVGSIPSRDQRFARLQVERFLAPANSRKIVRQAYASIIQAMLEALRFGPLLADEDSVECENEDILHTLIAARRGLVVLTAHLGNWELLAAWLVKHGISVTTAGKETRSPISQRILSSMREGYGVNTIWRSSRPGLRELIRNLQAGNLTAALIDQDTEVTSLMVPFFGVPARTPSGMVELAIRTKASIVSLYIVRVAPSRYRIEVHEIVPPAEASSTEKIYAVLKEYNSRLERIVRAYPNQWVWFHKRWRSDPTGVRRSAQEYERWLSGATQ